MARDYFTFKFNLLPPKSELEIQIEDERDDSIVYAIVLVLFSFAIYALLLLAQIFVLAPRANALGEVISVRELQADSFSDIRSKHGELFIKSLTLEPLLEKALNPVEIFQVADSIIAFDQNSGIINYSREADGVLVFEILATTPDRVPQLLDRIETLPEVKSAQVRSIEIGSPSNITKIVLEVSINVA